MLGQHTVHDRGASVTDLYLGRPPWADASAALLYLGLLVLVGGLAVQVRAGWRESEIRVLPYRDVALGPGETLQLRLLDVHFPSPDAADRSVPTANLQIAGQTILPIQLGEPVRRRGYRYLWVAKGGPSVRLSAYRTSDPDRPLILRNYQVSPEQARELHFSFASGQEPDRQFILSDDKIVGWLRWQDEGAASGQDNQTFQLWLFGEAGQELGIETFEQTESEPDAAILHAVVGNVDYRLEVARYIVLDIARQPGQWMFWLGACLLALSIPGHLAPKRETWVQVRETSNQVLVKVREQSPSPLALFGRDAGHATVRLRTALQAADSPDLPAGSQQSQPDLPNQNHTTHRNDR
jgi:hypothetical protein